MHVRLLAVLLFMTLAAGCTKPSPSTTIFASASNGYFVDGWGYDGVGVQKMTEGFIVLEADDATNLGAARAEAVVDGRHYRIAFTRAFEAPDKAFQDGGVRFGFQEHGTTMVGDASIPEVHAEAAAWGEGTVELDGQTLVDLTIGSPLFGLHYMLISAGVRDDEKHAIFADASRSQPYDPASPTAGNPVPGDRELMLVVRSKGTGGEDGSVLKGGAVDGTSYSKTETFDVPLAYSQLVLDFSVRPRDVVPVASATGPYDLSFQLKDPDNEIVRQGSLRGQAGETQARILHVETYANKTGSYKLVVTGQGVGVDWEISGLILAPKPVLWNLWWEDVLVGEEAKAFATSAKITAKHGHAHH